MEIHLQIKNTAGPRINEVRRIGKVRAKINGIIIVQRMNIKTLPRMGRDFQMRGNCRRLSEISRDTSDKTVLIRDNTLCH